MYSNGLQPHVYPINPELAHRHHAEEMSTDEHPGHLEEAKRETGRRSATDRQGVVQEKGGSQGSGRGRRDRAEEQGQELTSRSLALAEWTGVVVTLPPAPPAIDSLPEGAPTWPSIRSFSRSGLPAGQDAGSGGRAPRAVRRRLVEKYRDQFQGRGAGGEVGLACRPAASTPWCPAFRDAGRGALSRDDLER